MSCTAMNTFRTDGCRACGLSARPFFRAPLVVYRLYLSRSYILFHFAFLRMTNAVETDTQRLSKRQGIFQIRI